MLYASVKSIYRVLLEPRSEKTRLRGLRPGSIQTRLYSDSGLLEA